MTHILFMAAVFSLSFGIGYILIAKVPPLLHTPLMSMTNAISAVIILGALVLLAAPRDGWALSLAALALAAASFNIVGGLIITDRMLKMFKTETPVSATARPENERPDRDDRCPQR